MKSSVATWLRQYNCFVIAPVIGLLVTDVRITMGDDVPGGREGACTTDFFGGWVSLPGNTLACPLPRNFNKYTHTAAASNSTSTNSLTEQRIFHVSCLAWYPAQRKSAWYTLISLVTSPRAPPGEKRSGERSRISWAYSPKR